MEEVINTFGIDWRLISSQIFNFVILVVALWYFLYTPILSVLDKRREKIEQGIKDAEIASESRKNAETEKTAIVKAAHDEAGAIALRAKQFADEKSAVLMREAEAKKQRVLEDAQKAGDELQKRLYKESEAEIAKTALLAAEKILRERAS